MFLNHLNSEIKICNEKLKTFFDIEKENIFYWETRLEITELQKKKLIKKNPKLLPICNYN